MPRTPRNSPNPTGRPRSKAAEAAARVAIVSGGGAEAAALDTPGASRSATYRAVERLTKRPDAGAGAAAVGFGLRPESPHAERNAKIRPDRRGSGARLGSIKFQIVHRDGHACVYCGATEAAEKAVGRVLTTDHVICDADGGKDDATNLVSACDHCNKSRGRMEFGAWCAKVGADAARIRALLAVPLGDALVRPGGPSLAPAPQAPPGGAHGGALAIARPSTLSPPGGWPRDRLEQIHRLVLARWQPGALATETDPARAEEGWGPRTGAALAAELGLDADGLRGLLLDVEALEVAGRLPPELARAQSLAVYVECENRARAALDITTTLAARRRIDALRGIEGRAADATAAKQALEALARAVVALPREMAVGALRAAVGGLGEDAAEALKVAVRAAQGSASG